MNLGDALCGQASQLADDSGHSLPCLSVFPGLAQLRLEEGPLRLPEGALHAAWETVSLSLRYHVMQFL